MWASAYLLEAVGQAQVAQAAASDAGGAQPVGDRAEVGHGVDVQRELRLVVADGTGHAQVPGGAARPEAGTERLRVPPGEHVGAGAVGARHDHHRRLRGGFQHPADRLGAGGRQVGGDHQQAAFGVQARGRPGERAVEVAGARLLLDHPAAHGVGAAPDLPVRRDHRRALQPVDALERGDHVLEHGDGQQPPLDRTERRRQAALGVRQGLHGNQGCRHSEHCTIAATWSDVDSPCTPWQEQLCLGTFVDSAGRQARFLAKSELYEKRWLGFILRNAGQIPVYRETRDAGQALVHAVEAMREGAAVVIYPEGTTTRNPDFSQMPAKSGVARLAALPGAPVVPAGIWGAQLLFARGTIGPFRRGIRLVLRAGPPLHLWLSPSSPTEEVNAARNRVIEAIGKLVDEAKEGWSPPSWYRPKQPP